MRYTYLNYPLRAKGFGVSKLFIYRMIGFLAFFGLLGLALATAIIALAPQTTTLDGEESNIRQLPTLSGNALNGNALTLPDDFTKDVNLVALPFDEEQQLEVLNYLPLFRQLESANERVGYYSVAPLPNLSPAVRLLVVGGIQVGLSDEAVRAVSMVLFLEDQEAFLTALDITDTEQMSVLVLAQDGRLLGVVTGNYTAENAEALQSIVNNALD